METTESLGRENRMPRWSNVVGWSALALGGSLGLHAVMIRILNHGGSWLISRLDERATGALMTGQNLAVRFGARAGLFIIVGLLVGAIVGSRVTKRPAIVAAAVALGYALLVVFIRESYERFGPVLADGSRFGSLERGPGWPDVWAVLYDVAGLIAIGTAALLAKAVARRKA